MLIAETDRTLLHLHMDRILRTVMKAGVTDLTMVGKGHLVRHRDVVSGTNFGADTDSGGNNS